MPIVLDTTVLAYAKRADHDLRDRCRGLISVLGAGDVEAIWHLRSLRN